MNSAEYVAIGLALLSSLLGAMAAFFAFRADQASRKSAAAAEQRWNDSVRPQPHLSFTAPPAPNQPIEIEAENLGGAMAAGAIVAVYGDNLFASVLTLPDKASPRRFLMPPVLKAWQNAPQPKFVLLAARDVSGRWWDCLEGKEIKEPKKWADSHLRDLRLQGAVNFPELTGN